MARPPSISRGSIRDEAETGAGRGTASIGARPTRPVTWPGSRPSRQRSWPRRRNWTLASKRERSSGRTGPRWDYANPATQPDPVAEAAKSWIDELSKMDVEVLVALEALDWLTPALVSWREHEVWYEIGRGLTKKTATKIADYNRRLARQLMEDAGIDPPHIERYLAGMKDSHEIYEFGFPLQLPRPEGNDGDLETTWFIVEARGHRRAEVYIQYGMAQRETMSKLDPKRLGAIIPRIVGQPGGSKNAGWLGRAIEWMPGANFVDLVLASTVDERPNAWLVSRKRRGCRVDDGQVREVCQADQRNIHALGARANCWRTLRSTECFHPRLRRCRHGSIGGVGEVTGEGRGRQTRRGTSCYRHCRPTSKPRS